MSSIRTKRARALSGIVLLCIVINCSVQSGRTPGGGRYVNFTIGGRTFTFAFGDAGIINTRANQTVTQAGALRLFENAPADRPTSGRVRLLSSSVRASATTAGKPMIRAQVPPLSGTATVRLSMAAGISADLCERAVLLAEFSITITSGVPTIGREEADLTSAALAVIASKDVTLCVAATADFDGVLELTEFELIFGGNSPGENNQLGQVRGQVVDAQSGAPLAGATVSVNQTVSFSLTDNAGAFSIGNAPAGAQTLLTSATGYIDGSQPVLVLPGGVTDIAIGLVRVGENGLNNIVLVLTWGLQPADLDLHLSGPDGNGGRFHAFYGARNPVPHACLDLDDRSSSGPETMTITSVSGRFVPGDYHVWVHNFSGQPELDVSGANVSLIGVGRQLAQFGVGGASGDSAQDIWQVVEFTVGEDGSVSNVRTIQVFAAGSASSTF